MTKNIVRKRALNSIKILNLNLVLDLVVKVPYTVLPLQSQSNALIPALPFSMCREFTVTHDLGPQLVQFTSENGFLLTFFHFDSAKVKCSFNE